MDVAGDEVGDVSLDLDRGVEGGYVAEGGFGLGQGGCGVGFVEEDLALEVGGFDEVAVDQREVADAGAGEEPGGRGSGGADSDDGDTGSGKALLSAFAERGEENLAGVAVMCCVLRSRHEVEYRSLRFAGLERAESFDAWERGAGGCLYR